MSVQEKIDTSSSGGRLVFHMFGALAEFKRNLVRERTQAGLNAARARGRKGGRPKVLEPAKRQLAGTLYNEKQHTIREICRMMGISKPTLYNYLAEAVSGCWAPARATGPRWTASLTRPRWTCWPRACARRCRSKGWGSFASRKSHPARVAFSFPARGSGCCD